MDNRDKTLGASNSAGMHVPGDSSNKTDQAGNASNNVLDKDVPADNANAASTSPSKYIFLRVISAERVAEMHFNMKPNTSFLRLQRSYCFRVEEMLGTLRFMFDGHRILETDTPAKLEMIDNDVIEVYRQVSGGGW